MTMINDPNTVGPTTMVITYAYDAANRMSSITADNFGTFRFGYDAMGRRTFLMEPPVGSAGGPHQPCNLTVAEPWKAESAKKNSPK